MTRVTEGGKITLRFQTNVFSPTVFSPTSLEGVEVADRGFGPVVPERRVGADLSGGPEGDGVGRPTQRLDGPRLGASCFVKSTSRINPTRYGYFISMLPLMTPR